MVLDNIAQRTGALIILAAPFHANRLAHGNLDVVNKVAVPDWLQDSIRKAKKKNILDRFLAEIVIDSIDLVLVKDLVQLVIQFARGSQIAAEWFFDNDPRPSAALV